MHNSKPTLLSALLLASLVLAMATSAQAQGRTDGARSLSLASSFIANGSGNSALYHNPAGIATSMMYTIEGSYLYAPDMNTFNASIVDSKLNPQLAGGVAYSYESSTDNDAELDGHDIRVALGSQLIQGRLVGGLSGRYLNYTSGDDSIANGFTLDIGAVLRITDGLFIGASGNNLINVCERNDPGCPPTLTPRTVGGGLSFGSPLGIQLSADVRRDLTDGTEDTWIYASGLELFTAQMFALRGGYRFLQGPGDHIAAGGFGIKSQSFGLDLGYQYNFGLEESRAVVALQLFMMGG
ncbi:MAG: hypothetical protein AAFS10_17855 [Myxococcota bacterium]